jgi:pimeloyl-ACP methyl ester carboxylesterase
MFHPGTTAVTRVILILVPFVLLLAACLLSCAPPLTVPVKTVNFTASGEKQQPTLVVFLPGLRDRSAVFADEGFTSALRASGVEADMIGVDAHLEYYVKKQFLVRMKEDVIAPAKRQGYRNIWLVGISLGGFGALWYDIENPGDLAGVVALSPYLGEPEVVAAVARAGGLKGWHPEGNGEPDDQQRIWQGLKSYESGGKSLNRLYLGYGDKDKFAVPDGMLAALLPPEQVFTVEGGHRWPVWRALWDEILKRRVFDGNGGE